MEGDFISYMGKCLCGIIIIVSLIGILDTLEKINKKLEKIIETEGKKIDH